MSFQFNEFYQFHSSVIDKFAFEAAGGNVYSISIFEEDDYVTMVRILFRLFFFIFNYMCFGQKRAYNTNLINN